MPARKKQSRSEKCSYCAQDQTEDIVGTTIKWLYCETCKRWAHLTCFEKDSSTSGSVNNELWNLIDTDPNIKDNWVFMCSKCNVAGTSIPEQLQEQKMFSYDQLVEMGVETKLLKPDVPVQPMSELMTEPTTSTSSGIAASMLPPKSPTSSHPPLGDFQAMIQFLTAKEEGERRDREAKEERDREERAIERREREIERRDREAKEERQLKEREAKEERDRREREAERQERIEREREKEDRDRQEREQARREDRHEMMQLLESRDDRFRDLRQMQMGESSSLIQGERAKIGLRLPFIKIPTFNGDVLKWMEFWDMFSATVHENPDLSPVQKLSHLKASLEGLARESIAQLTMTNDNYDVAVEILKRRYGDKRAIEEKLFRKLKNLPTSSMRLDDLRRNFHTVEQSLEQLRNINEHFARGSSDVGLLFNTVKEKFPPKIIVDVERKQEDDWSMKDLMSELEKLIRMCEREAELTVELYGQKGASVSTHLPQPGPKGNFSTNPNFRGNFGQKPRSSADALMASGGPKFVKNGKIQKFSPVRKSHYPPLGALNNNVTQYQDLEQTRKSQYPCIFCKGEHFPDECDKYKTADTRKTQLYIDKRCYMCLKPDHSWRNCPSPWKQRPCKGCQQVGVHHFSICKDWLEKKANGRQSHMNLSFQERQPIPTENSSPPVLAENHMASGDMNHLAVRHKSVMQTTKLPVQDPASKRILHANVFMDSGSNICWMSKAFCQRLGLKERYKKTISVKTFGTLQEKMIKCFATGVDLFTMDNQVLPIEVTVIDNLACPLSKPALSAEDLKFLEANQKGLRLAPGTTSQWENEFPVDIIIGQDYYWQLINLGEKAIRLPSGLQLIPSKFGYLLGGGSLVSESSPATHQSVSHFVLSQPNEVISTLTSETEVKLAVKPVFSLEDFWHLERNGILGYPVENDDDRALDRLNETIKFENANDTQVETKLSKNSFQVALDKKECADNVSSEASTDCGFTPVDSSQQMCGNSSTLVGGNRSTPEPESPVGAYFENPSESEPSWIFQSPELGEKTGNPDFESRIGEVQLCDGLLVDSLPMIFSVKNRSVTVTRIGVVQFLGENSMNFSVVQCSNPYSDFWCGFGCDSVCSVSSRGSSRGQKFSPVWLVDAGQRARTVKSQNLRRNSGEQCCPVVTVKSLMMTSQDPRRCADAEVWKNPVFQCTQRSTELKVAGHNWISISMVTMKSNRYIALGANPVSLAMFPPYLPQPPGCQRVVILTFKLESGIT